MPPTILRFFTALALLSASRKAAFALLFFTLACSCVPAQKATDQSDPLRGLNKKERAQFGKAQSLLDFGNTPGALEILDELIEDNGEVARLYFVRSLAHGKRKAYAAAASDVDTGLRYDPDNVLAYKELGRLQALANNYQASYLAYQKYQERSPGRQREEARRLVELSKFRAELVANPVPFTPTPMGPGVNTAQHLEYFPSFSVDRRRLIFTRRIGSNEDFYFSERDTSGQWDDARPVPGINTGFNEGAQTITADGNYMVYTSCDQPGSRGGCDLFYATRRGGQWSPGRPLPGGVNSRDYEAQPSISSNGKLLFFSSKRGGGKGGADLYVSIRLPGGDWASPTPIAALNTKGNERYPFWAADGRTLYFTSDGYDGMGGEDLFAARVLPDNTWGEPQNLGYPINTAEDETNLFVDLDGRTAYFSKGRPHPETGRYDVDIFQFDLPEAARAVPATYVSARVTDAETGQPVVADVVLRPLDDSSAVSVEATDAQGRFLTVLPAGKDYGMTVEAEGYLFYADQFALSQGFTQTKPYELTIELMPVDDLDVMVETREEDNSTAFKNVLFATGSAELVAASTREIDGLAKVLLGRPDLSVTIAGHTDNVGGQAANLDLSERRAAAVRDYLVESGVDAGRISTVGYGEDRPVETNETPAGRAANRRTTFRLER